MLDIETLTRFLNHLRNRSDDGATTSHVDGATQIRLADAIRSSIQQDGSLLTELSLTQVELNRLPHH